MIYRSLDGSIESDNEAMPSSGTFLNSFRSGVTQPAYMAPAYTAPTYTAPSLSTPVMRAIDPTLYSGTSNPVQSVPTPQPATPAPAPAPAPSVTQGLGLSGALNTLGTGFGSMSLSDLLTQFNKYQSTNANGDFNGFTSWLSTNKPGPAFGTPAPTLGPPGAVLTAANPTGAGNIGGPPVPPPPAQVDTAQAKQNYYSTHGYYPGLGG